MLLLMNVVKMTYLLRIHPKSCAVDMISPSLTYNCNKQKFQGQIKV